MKYILSIALLLSTLVALAQPITTIRPEDAIVEANLLIEEGDYYNALELLRIAQKDKEERNDELNLAVAFAYYKLRDYKNARRSYERVLKNDVDNIYIDDRYAYGRTLRALNALSESREQFSIIKQLSGDEELKQLAEIELEGIAQLGTYPKNEEIAVSFSEGKINSGSGEYSPTLFDEKTLYFTSFDRNKEIVLDGSERKFHAKIYRSTKGEKGYEKPEELDSKVNRPGYHVGNVAFSPDRKRMYYTRQLLENDIVTSSAIFYSNLIDDEWSAAEEFPNINGEHITKQMAEGELLGERVLFFVSDMEGGYGGDDIYYVSIANGRIGQPVNLGAEINTPFDEITPHYYDGKLYFSTDGRPGVGGFDIYSSEWSGSSWAKPTNVGQNFNSPLDDFYLYFDKKGINGYLVSNRPDDKKKKMKSETCCYDIYQFNIRQLNIDLLVGVGDATTGEPMDGATVEVIDKTIKSSEDQTLEDDYRFKFGLNSDRKYEVITSKEGYISDTLELSTYGITEDKSIRKKVMLDKLKPAVVPPAEPQYVIDTVTINEAIRFDNIYYDFEKWNILPESESDLTIIMNLMNEYPDMVIELSSHTDSRGLSPYNANLSQKRAESAKEWLVNRGISEDRIIPKGYGESKILNRCVNGVRCTDEEHRFNRRTEFKIIEGPETIEIKREVKKEYDGGKQSIMTRPSTPKFGKVDSVPVLNLAEPIKDIGTMTAGETKEIVYVFANTGNAPLLIELASACKCTDITWPTKPVMPGEQGRIVAIFDSKGMEGDYLKTIDIIANTDPIVVEAKFNVKIVAAEKK